MLFVRAVLEAETVLTVHSSAANNLFTLTVQAAGARTLL